MKDNQKWQNIIGREWRNCDDKEYAEHLFNLIADERINTNIFSQPLRTSLLLIFPLLAFKGFRILFILALPFFMPIVLVGCLIIIEVLFSKDFTTIGSFVFILASFILLLILVTQYIRLHTWRSWLGTYLFDDSAPIKKYKHNHWIYEKRKCCLWWKNRSSPLAVERALQYSGKYRERKIWESLLSDLEARKKEQAEYNGLIKDLRHQRGLEQFKSCYSIVILGGEVVERLAQIARNKNHKLQQIAVWLLYSIAEDTEKRLASASRLVCEDCFVRCGEYKIDIPGQKSLTFYGCQSCHQSRHFFEWSGEIVAMLDTTMKERVIKESNSLQVNWLSRRSIFDFDRVEICRATDKDVEQFAIQVGNDTDPKRESSYKNMQCLVKCDLSENTMRILKNTLADLNIEGSKTGI